MSESLRREILALEQQLLQPETRCSRDFLQRVLAEDFVEFGKSGGRWDKAGVIEWLGGSGDAPNVEIEGFQVHLLAADIALATYRSVPRHGDRAVQRSSIWQRHPDHGWQMRFHQGTPVAG